MPKPLFLFALALASTFSQRSMAAEPVGSRPNIVFILSDDMGWNQPGFNGGKKELTPNIDKLAGESLSLTQFYTHSVCAPTRAAFLTGRYAFRTWSDWRSEDFGKPSYLKALGLTDIVKKLAARLAEVGAERPPLGDKPLLMDPPLPYIYGQEENKDVPAWLKKHIDAIRATQPKEWAPGATPWPQAPKGAHAAKQ